MKPTLDEARRIIAQEATAAATRCLAERGITFSPAEDQVEAKHIFSTDVRRFIGESDLEGAGASLLRCLDTMDPTLAEHARKTSELLTSEGDTYFYDDGAIDDALTCYRLAAGLVPDNVAAVRSVVSVCLQGHESRPEVALPYAVVNAHLNPEQDEVDYIVELAQRGETEVRGVRSSEELGAALRLFRAPSPREGQDPAYWSARLEVMPDDTQSYLGRANAYVGLLRDADAMADLDRALDLEPDNSIALTARGVLHGVLEDFERATADFTAALESDNASIDARRHRAVCLARLGRYEEALVDTADIIARGAAQRPDYQTHGNVLTSLGRNDEALASYRHALLMDPVEPEAHMDLANCYRRRGQSAEALPYLDNAWRLGHEAADGVALTLRHELGIFHEAIEALLDANSAFAVAEVVKRYPFVERAAFIASLEQSQTTIDNEAFKAALADRVRVLKAWTEPDARTKAHENQLAVIESVYDLATSLNEAEPSETTQQFVATLRGRLRALAQEELAFGDSSESEKKI